ncbi:MAG TPA: sugar phosphate isomerase/epimerase [Capsulimonadaceae bacterium]|nr:sugar phosphate isomerase/epimerase [Capsulimonadaceae bacterium]
MSNEPKLNMVLTAYGIPHVMGYLATKGGDHCKEPIGWKGLMDIAVENNIAGVEVHLPKDAADREAFVAALRERNLKFVGDYSVILNGEVEEIKAYLKAHAALGVKVMRAMISGILCGDRRKLEGGWPAYLERTAARLRELLPFAEDLGMAIAMENHQDATSDDLLNLWEMAGKSPAYGVTLDAGNPLAVGEDPVEFARRLGPLLRHAHMKDYTIHFSPEGYRLVRCAAGDGVVDFPAILEILRANGHDVLPGIEIGAQQTRTIPLLEPGWWECHLPEQPSRLVGALRVLWAKGRPMDEPYSSAWERGDDSPTVCEEEWNVLRRSIAYFHKISS